MSYKRWTQEEDDTLINMAGYATTAEIASALNRSTRSVSSRATTLRAAGRLLWPLRAYKPTSTCCPVCGVPRTEFVGDSTMCRVCAERKKVKKHMEDAFKAWEAMSDENRAKANYSLDVQGSTLIGIGRKRLDEPEAPERQTTRYLNMKAWDGYYQKLEAYELDILRRDINAYKQRKYRWRRKKDE